MRLLEELINLYNLHDKPETLYGYDKAYNEVPQLAWQMITHWPAEDIDEESYNYLNDVQEEQLRAREKLWAQDPKTAVAYAQMFGERFPAGEPAIATDAYSAYWYARFVIKEKFPAGEDAIAQDPQIAYLYAQYVIKGRFPAGEDAIAKDPEYAYYYAVDVIKGRWPPGEDAIATIKTYKEAYANDVIKDKLFWSKKEQGKIK